MLWTNSSLVICPDDVWKGATVFPLWLFVFGWSYSTDASDAGVILWCKFKGKGQASSSQYLPQVPGPPRGFLYICTSLWLKESNVRMQACPHSHRDFCTDLFGVCWGKGKKVRWTERSSWELFIPAAEPLNLKEISLGYCLRGWLNLRGPI